MSSALTIRRGVNFDAYFDSYTDPTNTTRIDYDGWKFTLSLEVPAADAPRTWSTDDTDPALTVVDAANPNGKRLAWHLDASETAALPAGGTLTLLRVDPGDAANVQPLTDPVPVSLSKAP